MESQLSAIDTISMIVSFALITTVFIAIARAMGNETYSLYYKLFKKRKVKKLLENGWEVRWCNSRGYPTTFKKDNEIIVI